MTTKQFTIVREFDAPRATIWRAWTDPTIAKIWWHPPGLVTPPESVQIDLREGGEYRYTMVLEEDGREWPTFGRYLEVREPKRLKFTWADPGDTEAEAPVITIDLRELGDDRCEMTFHILGIADDRGTAESVYDGWAGAFDLLDAHLAS